jgi:hypothetical protein
MTEDDVKRVAKETVKEFLVALGVNAGDGASMLELQKDFAFVREIRLSRAALQAKVWMTIIGFAVTGIVAGFWSYVVSAVGKH